MTSIARIRLRRCRRGARTAAFTLIELLVVISIIALLLSIMLPSLASAREEGKSVKCAADLHAIGIAMASCQNDNNGFFPMWDDGERSTVNNRIIATWLDALKQRNYYGWDGGYCPTDRRPDYLNQQRGAAWNFNYPVPASANGVVKGVDYSYGISIPLASGAHLSDNKYTYGAITEPAKHIMQRNIDRRVLVGEAYWDWIHNMSGFALKFGVFDVGAWYNNTAGYRHGMEQTRRPWGNYCMQDLHVERVRYDISMFNKGVDTGKAFITYPGEPLGVYPALGGNPVTPGFPAEIDPYEITGANPAEAKWDYEIRSRKGWGV